MHRRLALPALALLALLAPLAARAETPAERAGRQLDRAIGTDRATEAGQAARNEPLPPAAQVAPMETDRRTLQPDVGRPEETGSDITGAGRSVGGLGRNPQR